MFQRRFLLSSATLLLAALPAARAVAQTSADGGAIEDIVVTAQRQSSSVQRTPLAITAVGGEALKERGIADLDSLTRSIPNVSFSRIASDARVFIRGVGLDSISSGVDGRVAVYADEVVSARPQGALTSLFDIERIEVLRGPQGTLYGRNATAGAVNIISNAPTDSLDGYASLTVGNYNLIRTEGAISGPLSDKVAARLAFQTNDRDGFGKNITTGNEVDSERSRAIRAKLRFDPTETLSVTLTGDYRWEKDNQGGFVFVRPSPGIVPVDIALGFAPPPGRRDRAGFDQRFYMENYGLSANAVLDLAEGIELTSITGYRQLDQSNVTGIDGTTSGNAALNTYNDAKQFSQEVRLSVTKGAVDLIVGGYYFHEKNGYSQRARLSGAYFGLPARPLLEGTSQGGIQKTDAYAVFAQGTIHLSDRLGVDLGARYSHEKRSIAEFFQLDLVRPFDIANQPVNGCLIPIMCRNTLVQDASWSSFDPKVALHYQFTDRVLGYASYSRGFKSGGFNFGGLQAPFDPEKLTDYEVGIKADLFDRRLRANIAGFYYDYKNLQVNVIEGLALVTRNAAEAKVYGIEAEITAVPVDDLRLAFNLAWLHSEYRKYSDINPLSGVREDLSGNQLSYAPKYKLVGEIAYTFHPGFADITPRAELSWVDRVQFSQFNFPFQAEPSRWELNLYLDIVRENNWTVSAFGRNVTNDFYYVSEALSAPIFGVPVVGFPAPPRTFGISVTKQF